MNNKKFFLTGIFYFFILSTLLSFSAGYSDNDTISLNSSFLPLNGTVNLSILFVENVSFDIDQVVNDSHVNVVYDSVIDNFNSNTTIIPFYYEIDDLLIYDNLTFFESFNITNNLTNDSILYTLSFNITYDEELFYVSKDYFLQLEDGVGGVVDVTQNLLPEQRSYSFRVRGLSGSTANLSCSEWFDCPLNITFSDDNLSRLTITITIPDVSVGVYKQSIGFIGLNNTKYSNWTFNVLAPEYIFEDYIPSPDCYLRTNVNGTELVSIKMDCYKEAIEFEYERQLEFINDLQDSFKCPVCSNDTITEYVVADKLSADIKFSYEQCIDDREDYKSNWVLCKDDLNSNIINLDSCSSELFVARNSSVEASERFAIDKIKAYEDAVASIKKSNKRKTRNVLFIVFGSIFLLVLFFVVRYLKNRNFGRFG